MRCVMYKDTCSCSGFGDSADVQTINCPPGTTANGDNQGNVWCQDAAGARTPATLTPAPGTGGSKMGVLGWSILIGGALLIGSVVLKKKR